MKPPNSKPKVAILYTSFPHYRRAVVETLSESLLAEYIFVGDTSSAESTIKTMDFKEDILFEQAPIRKYGRFFRQPTALKKILPHNPDVVVILGLPYVLSYWAIAAYFRARRIPVYFWTHGWINSKEHGIKKIVRNTFYRIANGLLLYGNRAKEIGIANGFKPGKLHVIYNSLDFDQMFKIYNEIEGEVRTDLKETLNCAPELPMIVCSARLTKLCRFDLLIDAVHELRKKNGTDCTIVLIGDGPEAVNLMERAKSKEVTLLLTGACYDEKLIAEYYHASDVAVSPGKVGLTAMHSLTYGTPLITHDNFDEQMPEYEAIQPGVSGDFFVQGDAVDLANTIKKWIGMKERSKDLSRNCSRRIQEHFSPLSQRREIERVILND